MVGTEMAADESIRGETGISEIILNEAGGNKAGGGLLIVVSGPSGVGKGTICKELLKRDVNLAVSVSATTRAQGPGEAHGREYFFYTDEAFQEIVDQGGFLEWAWVHGWRYGTMKGNVQEIIDSGKDCILEIDVQGGMQVADIMGNQCVLIFMKAPSEEELLRRITKRNRDNAEDVKRRMLTAQWEMTQEEKYQYTVVNDQIDETVVRIMDIIREERREHASAIN